jgi:hypothetical protein
MEREIEGRTGFIAQKDNQISSRCGRSKPMFSFIFFNSKDLAGGAIVSNPKSAVVYKGPGIS